MRAIDNTAGETPSDRRSRRRDRRRGLSDVLHVVSRSLAERDGVFLRGAFEESVRQLLSLRAVHLRDGAGRWPRRMPDPAVETVALDVPSVSPKTAGVLEAVFEHGCPGGEWEFQMLSAASHLGALVLEIERARTQALRIESAAAVKRADGAAPLIGSTPAMAALRARIERVAATDFTVLLEGESGVGKELVARQIHDLSVRRHGPFVAINCAALVETLLEAELFGIEERTATGVKGRRGKFEHAHGGTLFLDEVSDLSLSAQAKLLRAIQDLAVERVGGTGTHRVDIRIIAATNRGLADLVARGGFRADLFYRLAGVDIRVPSLRERRPDIRELAIYFLARHRTARPLQLSDTAIEALLAYEWPGNVRELERVMEHAVAMASGEVIELDDLPPRVRGDYDVVLLPSLERDESLRAWACRYARLMLEKCGGNRRETARILGISYHTLRTYIRLSEAGGMLDDQLPVGAETQNDLETEPV